MSSEYLYWQVKAEAAGLESEAAFTRALREKELSRPCMMLKPALSRDGNQWCALYGENLQDGVAGFGDSPEKAYVDFDESWRRDLEIKEKS